MTDFVTVLNRLWPNGDVKIAGLRLGIAAQAPAVFTKYGLTTNLLVAHAMAQFSHECGAGLEMVENINYSAERACQVWPPPRGDDPHPERHFSSPADCYRKCDSYAGDPQFRLKLIDHVYGGRMGNQPYPSHDGSTYIGRGLAQTTGREGYQAVKDKTGIDVISNPGLFASPRYTLELGVADFIICGCLPYAKGDDVVGVTKKLNGGTVGLAEREAWLAKWKQALATIEVFKAPSIVPPDVEPVPTPQPAPKPTLQPKHVGIGAVIAAAFYAAAQFWQAHHVAVLIGAGVIAVAAIAYLIIKRKGTS